MFTNPSDSKFNPTLTIGIPYTGCEYVSDIPVTSEQEAIGIACGVELGGGSAVVFMQDSGFLNCINNITSLVTPYGFNKSQFYVKEVEQPEHHRYSNAIYRKVRDKVRRY